MRRLVRLPRFALKPSEGVLQVQLDDALVRCLRSRCHYTECIRTGGALVVIRCDGLGRIVNVVVQGQWREVGKLEQRMVQPIECTDPELYLLFFVNVERSIERQVTVVIWRGSHIGIRLTTLRSHRWS